MAVDYFLKVDDIKGESKDKKKPDEILLQSWSFGATQSGTFGRGGGGASGKVNLQDFSFVKDIDKASSTLYLRCCDGKHLKEAKLTCRKAGEDQQEYFTVTMKDIIVSSFSTSGAGEVPVEQVTFNFAEIAWLYKPQKADGTLDSGTPLGWNLAANAKV
jgi:type VI secretion system secreted protein Hcp